MDENTIREIRRLTQDTPKIGTHLIDSDSYGRRYYELLHPRIEAAERHFAWYRRIYDYGKR